MDTTETQKSTETQKVTMQAPLVPVTLAFLSGILLGTYARLTPVGLIVVGTVSAGVALWRWRRTTSGVIALLVLWGCLGALRMAIWERHPDTRLTAVLSDEPQSVQLHGLVVDDPVELFEPGEAHTVEGDDATVDPDRQVCVVALRHVRVADGPSTSLRAAPPGRTEIVGRRWQPITGRLRATVYAPKELLRYGDEVVVEGQWSRVPAAGNPGQYDWQAALARKRIHGLLRVRPFDGLVVLQRGQGNPVLAAVFRLRERWVRLIQEHFEPRDAGLLLALLLGERTEIDEDLKEAFTATGTIHLLVISGFNVGLVAGLLELFFRVLGLPWRFRLCFLAISLGGYCILTGLQPPVARATLMAWIVLGAYALDRVIAWPNTLAAAALIILGLNPMQLFDPGFQLSFGAVLSLLGFASRWYRWLEPRLSWMRPAWLRRYVAISLSTTSSVWVGLAPVLAWYFHLVSPVSMLANLLIAPLMGALVFMGTTLLMLGTVFDAVVRWGSGVLTLLLDATLCCVSWCHTLPGGYWFVGHPSPFFLIGYYGLVGVSVLRARLGWSQGRLLICWVVGLMVWVWSAVTLRVLESRWLRVDVLDVGHGDSLVVRMPGGHTLLVDAGSQEAGRYRVVPFLRFVGVTSVDALVLTHTDEDHLGGAIPLLKEIRVRRLLTNGVRDDTMSARQVQYLAAAQPIDGMILTAGMKLGGDPGIGIEVLHPPLGLVPGCAPESNDNSVVLRLTRGAVTMMLSGDIEEAGLPWLLRQDRPLRSAVLKVPHHGSRLGQIGEQFFLAVAPTLAILSAGRAHHLPAPETVLALQRSGSALYSTRQDGAIHLRTDGVHLEVKTFKRSSRWQRVDFASNIP
jgi:competence protein ComEC